jgi:hypothetical protein
MKQKYKYKDSEQAYFGKESGDPNEIVKVIDEDNGKIFFYSWERGKSNKNIDDTSFRKKGFSFYLARYVFFDEYFYFDDELAENENYTGTIGVIFGDKNQEELIIINTEDISGVTVIISAYYADDPKYDIFVKKYWKRREKMRKIRENMLVLSKEKLLHLQKLTEKWHSAK